MSDTVWIRGSRRSRMNVSTRPSSSPRARLDASTTDLTGALALTGSCGSWMTRPGVVSAVVSVMILFWRVFSTLPRYTCCACANARPGESTGSWVAESLADLRSDWAWRDCFCSELSAASMNERAVDVRLAR